MELLQALHDAGFAAALRRANLFYPLLNAFHILSIGIIVGAIGTLDLRLLGAFRTFSLSQLAPPLSRMAAIGVGLALASGFFLFSVQPKAYAANQAFLMKVGLAVCGIANALILHKTSAWRQALADGPVTVSAKAQAALSLTIWTAAVISGRWIAFVD
ncbi:MAG: DUF2214 domain-containing protein [Proteobacteria bacterium]|nr:DUF2214 domain-containing protein [Pseudomonadota bacterium]